jgi:hypothetical protein
MPLIPLAELVQQAKRAHDKAQEFVPFPNTRNERDRVMAMIAQEAPDLHFVLRAPGPLDLDALDLCISDLDALELVPLVQIGERR